jgi:hypothetical protein
VPHPPRDPAATGRRSVLVRVLGGVGVLGMASPLIWVVALAVMWFVARDSLNGDLVFTVFATTLLAMVVGVLLFGLADRLDQRGKAPAGEDDAASELP